MQNFDQVCHLCLGGKFSNLIASNDCELTMKIGRVFYFKVTFLSNSCGLICETCKTIIEQFYQYAERVARNQELLRASKCEAVDVNNLKKERAGIHENSNGKDFSGNDHGELMEEQWLETGEEQPTECSDFQQAVESPERDEQELPIESVDVKTERCDGLVEIPEVKTLNNESNEVNDESYEDERLSPEHLVLRHYNLSCDLCSTPLTDFADLRKHFKQTHDVPAYLRCCNRTIYKKCWMIEHLQLHLNPDSFRCEQCSKSYSSSKVLKEHQKEVHAPQAERSFHCSTCHKGFVTQAHLNAHIMVAHGSVRCPQCDKVLASQGSLRKHLVSMHGEGEQHICDVCARVFRSKQSFETHRKDHEGRRLESKMQCELCSVWLTDKYCLRKHMQRMHNPNLPQEPIECGTCGKNVPNQTALKSHIRRVHGASRFECERCEKTFKRPHHMREHMAIYHTGEELYGCLYCSERFTTKNKQYFHHKTAHTEEYQEELKKRRLKE
uniref:C2H2-type domain-containing protein n=1 Tax=Anopheles farauti TaxID=69004 RepID=A0A182Q9L4_9DIPT